MKILQVEGVVGRLHMAEAVTCSAPTLKFQHKYDAGKKYNVIDPLAHSRSKLEGNPPPSSSDSSRWRRSICAIQELRCKYI